MHPLRLAAVAISLSALFLRAADPVQPLLRPAGEGIKAPENFSVSLVAADPLVKNPATLCVADDGRIFICEDYVHANVPGIKRDVVKVLLGAEKGGKATEAITLAEDLNSVQGMAYHDGKLFFAHSPKVSYITVSADNKAGPVIDLFDGFGLGKGFKPSHGASGMFVQDGKLYMIIGDQGCDTTTKEGKRLAVDSGVVLRCNFDGSELEVWAHGFRNTYGIALDPLGNGFMRDNTNDGGGYNVRNYHVVKGSYFGWPFRWRESDSASFPPDVLTKSKDNGGGSPCGTVWVSSPAYPEPYTDCVLSCEWGRGMIIHCKPEPKGATFELPETTFLADEKLPGAPYQFRPTNIVVAPDQSLLIADWGTSPLYPTTAKGRVLRVKYTGPAPRPVAPHAATLLNSKTPAAELIQLLSSEDAVLRARAAYLLGERKHKDAAEKLTALLSDTDPTVRLRAATALGDIGDAKTMPSLITAFGAEKDRWVRHILLRGLKINDSGVREVLRQVSTYSDNAPAELLFAVRELYEPHVAEGLIEISKSSKNISLAALATEFLGLIAKKEEKRWTWGDKPNIAQPVRTVPWEATEKILQQLYSAVRHPEAAVRNKAIEALTKLKDTTVVDAILADLASGKVQLNDETAGILIRSAGNEKALPQLAAYLSSGKGTEATRIEIVRMLTLHNKPEALDALRATAFSDKSSEGLAAEAVAALGRAKDKASTAKILELLQKGQPQVQWSAAAALGQIADPSAAAALEAAAASNDRSLKTQALIALLRLEAAGQAGNFARHFAALTPADDVIQADVLEAMNTPREKIEPLLLHQLSKGALGKTAEPEAIKKIKAWTKDDFGYSTENKSKRASALTKAGETLAKKFPKWKAPEVASKAVAADDDDEDARLEKLAAAALKSTGNAANGAAVFRNKRGANCIACHIVKGEGARVGPELTEVGSKYPRATLIESVLYPSKQLLDGYELSVITLQSGERVSAIIQSEDDQKFTVAKSDGSISTIPAAEVTRHIKSKNSLMPDGLANAMTQQEFFDLIAYLETLKKAGE